MGIHHYINEINREFVKGDAGEHSYRPALKFLLEELCENIDATNEPKKSEGGNPDYQITKKGTKLPVAFIEAKEGASITKEEVIKFCKENLANFKVPKEVIFRELPKTSTGKIQKVELRKFFL